MTPPVTQRIVLDPNIRSRLAALASDFPPTEDADHRRPLVGWLTAKLLRHAVPEWDNVLAEVRRCLSAPPHFAIIRGLPVDPAVPVLLGALAGLADPVEPYHTEWSRLVRRIRVDRADTVQPGYGALDEALHTDSSDWPDPNELTCLLCLRPDAAGGGATRLLPREALVQTLNEHAPGIAELLERTAVPWAVAEDLGGGVVRRAILGGGVRWLRYGVDAGIKADGVPAEVREAIATLHDVVEHHAPVVEFDLASGDLLVVNNRQCLHARTAVANPLTSDRELLRIKARWAAKP